WRDPRGSSSLGFLPHRNPEGCGEPRILVTPGPRRVWRTSDFRLTRGPEGGPNLRFLTPSRPGGLLTPRIFAPLGPRGCGVPPIFAPPAPLMGSLQRRFLTSAHP